MKIVLTLVLLITTTVVNSADNVWESDNISQAVFALKVENRVPKNIVNTINNTVNKIFFFTNLRNLNNKKITHRWLYNGRNMAEVDFYPKGNRWRVYSSKNLWHKWLGTWQVNVVDEDDNILLSKSFTYAKVK